MSKLTIAKVNEYQWSSSGSQSSPLSIEVPEGTHRPALVVAVWAQQANEVPFSTVAYDGESMTQAVTNPGSDWGSLGVWWLSPTSQGTNDLTFTWTNGGAAYKESIIHAYVFDNVGGIRSGSPTYDKATTAHKLSVSCEVDDMLVFLCNEDVYEPLSGFTHDISTTTYLYLNTMFGLAQSSPDTIGWDHATGSPTVNAMAFALRPIRKVQGAPYYF
jgi:hypothetical protein